MCRGLRRGSNRRPFALQLFDGLTRNEIFSLNHNGRQSPAQSMIVGAAARCSEGARDFSNRQKSDLRGLLGYKHVLTLQSLAKNKSELSKQCRPLPNVILL